MDTGAIVLGFIPVASALLGAGATYLWQVLGNRRGDKAVRIQTNARLAEVASFLSTLYAGWYVEQHQPILQRLVRSLDDVQIALAFRNEPAVLWKLARIRFELELISPQTAEKIKSVAKEEPDKYSVEALHQMTTLFVGDLLAETIDAFTDDSLKQLALSYARDNGYDPAKHRRAADAFKAGDSDLLLRINPDAPDFRKSDHLPESGRP